MRRAILQAYPNLAGETFAVEGKGWDSLAVDVGGRLIFKFPDGKVAGDALVREARLLEAVRPRVSMAVPRLTLHHGPPLFSRHDKLQGSTLVRGDYLRLGETARDRLAEDLALFFCELHAIDLPVMREAGAQAVHDWDTGDETLAPVWGRLPPDVAARARQSLDDYRDMGEDPAGKRYGFFDAHGWNMAFDHAAGRLNGIFDFADSGFGPVHREFVPVSLVDPDLAARTARRYERLTGRTLDRRRIFLLSAAMRLSEFVGAIAERDNEEWTRSLVADWFAQDAMP